MPGPCESRIVEQYYVATKSSGCRRVGFSARRHTVATCTSACTRKIVLCAVKQIYPFVSRTTKFVLMSFGENACGPLLKTAWNVLAPHRVELQSQSVTLASHQTFPMTAQQTKLPLRKNITDCSLMIQPQLMSTPRTKKTAVSVERRWTKVDVALTAPTADVTTSGAISKPKRYSCPISTDMLLAKKLCNFVPEQFDLLARTAGTLPNLKCAARVENRSTEHSHCSLSVNLPTVNS